MDNRNVNIGLVRYDSDGGCFPGTLRNYGGVGEFSFRQVSRYVGTY